LYKIYQNEFECIMINYEGRNLFALFENEILEKKKMFTRKCYLGLTEIISLEIKRIEIAPESHSFNF